MASDRFHLHISHSQSETDRSLVHGACQHSFHRFALKIVCICFDYTIYCLIFSGLTYESIGYREMLDIFKVVTEDLKQKAIIIDSDDLVDDPGMNFRPEF